MQVFVSEPEKGVRHILAITQRTFEEGDFGRLLDRNLLTALKAARGGRITLTPRGLREEPGVTRSPS
jgi:hypothetical protein